MRKFVILLMIAVFAVSIFATMGAPTEFNVQVDEQDFIITWENPQGGNMLNYDTGNVNQWIGFMSGSFTVPIGIRFDTNDLAQYDNYVLDYISLHHRTSENSAYVLTIYQGGDATAPDSNNVVLSQNIDPTSDNLVQGINYIPLTSAITIDASMELWIVLKCETTSTNPIAAIDDSDLSNTAEGKGNLIKWSDGWSTFGLWGQTTPQNPGNWNIRGYLTAPAGNRVALERNNNAAPSAPVVYTAQPDAQMYASRFTGINNTDSVDRGPALLKGYKVYQDGTEVADYTFTDDIHFRYYTSKLAVGTYTFNVTTLSEDLVTSVVTESPMSADIPVAITTAETRNAPRGIDVVMYNGNEPVISWTKGGADLGETRVALDGDEDTAGQTYGYVSFSNYEFAVRYEPSDLQDIDDNYITNVRTVFDTLSIYTLKIYQGGSVNLDPNDTTMTTYIFDEGTLAYEQLIVPDIIGYDSIVDLDTPFQIDASQEIWIAFEVNQCAKAQQNEPNTFPICYAGNEGEIHDRKGNLLKFGSNWQSRYDPTDTDPDEDISRQMDFYINFYATATAPTTAAASNEVYTSKTYKEFDQVEGSKAIDLTAQFQPSNSRDFTGYVVRIDEGTEDSLTYQPTTRYGARYDALNGGDHTVSVTAVYDDGAEFASAPVNFTFELPAPSNITGEITGGGTIYRLRWDPPEFEHTARTMNHYNVYMGTSMDDLQFQSQASVESYIHQGFDDTQVYYYKVTAVYNGAGQDDEYESEGIVHKYPQESNDDNDIDFTTTKVLGAYPNPFNPTTTISYNLAKDSDVEIVVYNMKGQKVRTLVDEKKVQGKNTVVWNGKDDNGNNTASGVYFYRLKADKHVSTHKLIMMK